MTARELRNIDREINKLKSKIARLEGEATKITLELNDMPSGGGISDTVGNITTQIVHIQREIQRLEIIKKEEINRLSNDIFQENCLFMYYGLRYSWTKIATKIGGNNTADGIRMMCERYEW